MISTLMKSILFFAASLCLVTGAYAEDIKMSSTTSFSEDAAVRKAVRDECQLETKLPTFIKEYAEEYEVNLQVSEKPDMKKGKVLVVEITHVNASGGGAFSGPKSVSVAGKLYENGKLISKFVGSRFSGGGMFGGFKGTCSIAGRCVKTLGSDIAKWLKDPKDDAHLGDS